MGAPRAYLDGLRAIHATGEAVEETSYYPELTTLLNTVGGSLTPAVLCVLTTKNRGAGVPDGGFFLKRAPVVEAGANALLSRAPERGVMEVKGPGRSVKDVAASNQVRKYLERYGQVLVTNYREFLRVVQDVHGNLQLGEEFSLAKKEDEFWQLCADPEALSDAAEAEFEAYLTRVLLADAPVSSPADLASFLAAYARTAKARLDAASDLKALGSLRSALEDALGLRFRGEEGEAFFRSALVQTLFYGVFAAWVVWSDERDPGNTDRFSWRAAQWTLNVPMVRVLFEQLATPSNLPVGLNEVLDWTEDVLARVNRVAFFERFEAADAVQYFYEPFLQEYDPRMRRELGVWYTPREVVKYMVQRVHEALKRDLALPLGLADPSVHVLDPCTGTGSFLVETIALVSDVLEAEHADGLSAHRAKEAALSRIHGFELLPAPFVVAHLQLGLLLERLGAPLDAEHGERAGVYLTNSLTGWDASVEHPSLPFPEFQTERDAADQVKQTEPILVVLGNPPYNGFAGVSGEDEKGLIDPYKQGLARDWDVTKNKLDDLYVRFFRIAERRIAERTGRGVVAFISNFGWLGDPSAVVMRERLTREFDRIYIDNLNGDSRETGKRTPDGAPDPSIFSTPRSQSGIQVGTAISLLVRRTPHAAATAQVAFRDFWGADKRDQLLAALDAPQNSAVYDTLEPTAENWYRLRRWAPRAGYAAWPSVVELAHEEPALGLNENRNEALIDHSRDKLLERMSIFLDPTRTLEDLDSKSPLRQPWARYDAAKTRARLLAESPFCANRAVRFQVKPFDLRWAYVDTTTKLWNEPRKQYVAAAAIGSDFLLVRRRAPRALDGAAVFYSRHLIDQHILHKDAYTIPIWLSSQVSGGLTLFGAEQPNKAWRPNLSGTAIDYAAEIGLGDAETDRAVARTIWMHVLAMAYSPLYLEENADAVRNDWPRVPLPHRIDDLKASAGLGEVVAGLLDLDTPVVGVDQGVSADLREFATLKRTDGVQVTLESLRISSGWGHVQERSMPSGASARAVMPSAGHLEVRAPSDAEQVALASAPELLGTEVLDVYLNRETFWSGVPVAAWDFKIGGFAVLRKWLSYRDERVIGRALTAEEAAQFTSIARRLTRLALLEPALDANYLVAAGADSQDALFSPAA